MKPISRPHRHSNDKQNIVKNNSFTAQWKKLSKRKTVKFGDARVPAVPISLAEYKQNVLEGQRAMARFAKAVAKMQHGIKLILPKGMPLYSIDSEFLEYGGLVRVLNDKIDRGVFKDEKFIPWTKVQMVRMRKQIQKKNDKELSDLKENP